MPDVPPLDSFGARLRWWRERRLGNKSQGLLAEKLKIGQGSLSELERGISKEPSATVLMKACDVLGLEPRYLLWGEGSPEGMNFQALSGVEAQLVMIFRALPEPRRAGFMIDANAELERARAGTPAPTPTIEPSEAERAMTAAARKTRAKPAAKTTKRRKPNS
jgi:transcriptional regulator with XRE-family HTH domain